MLPFWIMRDIVKYHQSKVEIYFVWHIVFTNRCEWLKLKYVESTVGGHV